MSNLMQFKRNFHRAVTKFDVYKNDFIPFTQDLMRELVDTNSGKEIPKPSRTVMLVQGILGGISEIELCFTRLKQTHFLIGRYSYRKDQISRNDYLQYHVEAYVNEVYILICRLRGFYSSIRKLYGDDAVAGRLQRNKKRLFDWIDEQFTVLLEIRNLHIHKERHTDYLNAMHSLLELSAKLGNDKSQKKLARVSQREILKTKEAKQVAWIAEQNKVASRIVNDYFQALRTILEKDGKFILPGYFEDMLKRVSVTKV